MQVQNPDGKYRRQLAGTWLSEDGACKAVFADSVKITVTYGEAMLDGYCEVNPTGIAMAPVTQGFMGMAMMNAGMGQAADGFIYQHDLSEDFQLSLADKALKIEDQAIYNIDFAWHDIYDRLHFDLSVLSTGEKLSLTLCREGTVSVPLKEGEVRCECGHVFSSKFCPECGRPRPAGGPETGA